MSGSAALPVLAALVTLTGCFPVDLESCRIICDNSGQACPADFQCLIPDGATEGLCANAETRACNPLPTTGSGGTGGGGTGGGGTGGGGAGGGGATSGPPSQLCHDGSCYTIPAAIQSELVLLLWPSNLPATVGATVSVWADQSGQGNDAHALDPTALPQVISDGVQLNSTKSGTGFVATNSASLDFGSGDFAIIVVAGLSSASTPVTLFRKSDEARTDSRQIAIDWVLSSSVTGRPQGTVDETLVPAGGDIPQPSVAAYTLYRATDHLELHLNGTVLGSADLPTPGMTTTNPEDVYLGVGSMFGSPADSIEAVIAIRGATDAATLNQLETFLSGVFAQSAP
jgi:hypothetical protein